MPVAVPENLNEGEKYRKVCTYHLIIITILKYICKKYQNNYF